MLRNIYEIFDEFGKAETKEDRIAILKKHDSRDLRRVLRAAFHPNIKFFLTKFPYYKPHITSPGTGDPIGHLMNKIYLFERGNPKAPSALSDHKRMLLLIQYLEGLEDKEAVIVINMMLKNLKVPYLTYRIVRETFPEILPEWQDGKGD